MSDLAASYARTATQEEGDTSLLTQQAANHALAQKLGYQIPVACDWLEQGSGIDATRPGFLALEDAVARRLISAVVVRDASRIARDHLILLQFVRLCEQSDVKLYFVDECSVLVAEFYDAITRLLCADR